MGERLLCKQEVDGSIPFTSTTDPAQAGVAPRQAQLVAPRSGLEQRAALAARGRRCRRSTRTRRCAFGRGSGEANEFAGELRLAGV